MQNTTFIRENDTDAMLFLPSDLFCLYLLLNSKFMVEKFETFIKNISERIGYYFNQHYMHEKLSIHGIHIRSDFIPKMYEYVGLLKSIKTVNNSHWRKHEIKNKNSTLFDKLSFKDNNNFIVDKMHFIFPFPPINEGQNNYYNDNTDLIHRVSFVYLAFNSIEESLSILKDIGDKMIQIDNLHISGRNVEECENLTNPEFFNGRLAKITYSFVENHALSDIFFSNINKINLRSLTLRFKYGVKSNFDIIKILNKVNQNTILTLENYIASSECHLLFSNASFKIVQPNYDPLYVSWDSFGCYIELSKINEHFWFTYGNNEDCNNAINFHISISREFSLDQFKIIDNENEIKEIDKYLSKDRSNLEKELEIIVFIV